MSRIKVAVKVFVVVSAMGYMAYIGCAPVIKIEKEGVVSESSESLFPLDAYNLLFLVPEKGVRFRYHYRVCYHIKSTSVKVSGRLCGGIFNNDKELEKFLRKCGFEKYAIIGGEFGSEEAVKGLLEEFSEEEVEMVCDGGEVEVWSMSISRFYYNPRKRTFLLWWWKLIR